MVVLDWIAVAVLTGLLGLWLADPANRPGTAEGNDVRVYHEAARGFGSTGSPYGTGFVSPAPFALLFAALAALSMETAAMIWLGVGLAALLGLTALSLHLGGGPVRPLTVCAAGALALLWPANNYGLLLGQNSVLVALLATAAVAVSVQRPRIAGVLLGVGAILKPHLVLPLTLGLAAVEVRRCHRGEIARGFGLGAGGLLVCAALYSRRWIEVLATAPPESWNYWGSTVGTNVFFADVLEDRAAGWFVLAILSITLALSVGLWWWRSAPDHTALAAMILAVTLLITPYAYPHDYVVLLLPLSLAISRLVQTRGRLWLPIACGLAIAVWLAPQPARYDGLRFVALAAPAALAGVLAWSSTATTRSERVTGPAVRTGPTTG